MVAPALSSIAAEFHITNEVESQLVLSIFVLAYAIGYVAPEKLVFLIFYPIFECERKLRHYFDNNCYFFL